MPEGADAVVQIEETEQLPPSAGTKRVKIVKVILSVAAQTLRCPKHVKNSGDLCFTL